MLFFCCVFKFYPSQCYLQLLFQMENPGITVEYTVDSKEIIDAGNSKNNKKKLKYGNKDGGENGGGDKYGDGGFGGVGYYWEIQDWSHCSHSCGQGKCVFTFLFLDKLIFLLLPFFSIIFQFR